MSDYNYPNNQDGNGDTNNSGYSGIGNPGGSNYRTSGGAFSGTQGSNGNIGNGSNGNIGNGSNLGDSTYRYNYSGGTGADNGSNHYPNDYTRFNNSYIPEEPKKKKDKKSGSGMGKKALAGILVGTLFGLSAGVSFYAVDSIAGLSLGGTKEAEVIESQSDSAKAEEATTSTSTPAITKTEVTPTVVTDVTKVVDEVMPSVVSITNTYLSTQDFWGQSVQNESEASGSGIIVGENDKELLIVTNNHVVEGADTLKVQFIDSEIVEAQIKGTDSNMDLAVIAVPLDSIKDSTKSSISVATLGDSDALTVGEPAIAIGNALGYGQSVTTGVISALNRQLEMSETGSTTATLIQTDAAINPGNSGGALLNTDGEVIGINSNKIGGTAIEGMGYAIPISAAKPIIEELMTKETKTKVDSSNKGFLGISGVNVTSDVAQMYGMPEGVYVAQVYDGTAAASAGLAKGDIITSFDGTTVTSMEDLQGLLEYYEAGATVNLVIQQVSQDGYKEKTVTVTLGSQKDAETQQETQQETQTQN